MYVQQFLILSLSIKVLAVKSVNVGLTQSFCEQFHQFSDLTFKFKVLQKQNWQKIKWEQYDITINSRVSHFNKSVISKGINDFPSLISSTSKIYKITKISQFF